MADHPYNVTAPRAEAKIVALAVGIDESRGDTVSVTGHRPLVVAAWRTKVRAKTSRRR